MPFAVLLLHVAEIHIPKTSLHEFTNAEFRLTLSVCLKGFV